MDTSGWSAANQAYLSASLSVLRELLRPPAERDEASLAGLVLARDEARAGLPSPSALDRLGTIFGLSGFELEVLLFAAGAELDTEIAARCGAAQGMPRGAHPTFSLAFALLADAHWSASGPEGPLRRFQLLEPLTGPTLTSSPLVVSERVLHYLLGFNHLDERLRPLLSPLALPAALPPSHQAVAARIAILWTAYTASAPLPVVQLSGEDRSGKRAVAAAAADMLGMRVHALHAAEFPAAAAERESLIRLWERDALLDPSVLFLDCEDVEGQAAWRSLASFVDRTRRPLIVAGQTALRLDQREAVRLELDRLRPAEQRQVWNEALGPAAGVLDGRLDAVVSSFDLRAGSIREAGREALALAGRPEDLGARLWEACRVRARPRLDDLAQRLEPAAGWDSLVLPAEQLEILHTAAAHVRRRHHVYERWGFGAKGARGLGISALFAGASGTGKTMAAEVLAAELGLDLYRVDLSQVVSKYIGETEKNLRRVFDAADEGGAVLLFDEADALFGKRSEVKDSHDRYANIEVGYLLQRMEAYRGLAILTTNMKNALDGAFTRRIRFIVTFAFPDAAQRAEIWRRIFPRATPTEGLDWNRLARLAVTGGSIRNIALNAAFLAADAGEPVRMTHLHRAAHGECVKLEKPSMEAEIRGWV
jgi:hypothetical protein